MPISEHIERINSVLSPHARPATIAKELTEQLEAIEGDAALRDFALALICEFRAALQGPR